MAESYCVHCRNAIDIYKSTCPVCGFKKPSAGWPVRNL